MKNIDMIFEELSHIAYMVNESNSSINPELVYEGFWDTVRKGASKIGQFGANIKNTAVSGINVVKSGIDYIKELGQKAWDKIVSLGEDFVNWIKETKQKAIELINIIKGTPSKVWSAMKEFFASLAKGIGEKIEKIKTGWETFVLILNTFIFKPIANAFSNIIKDVKIRQAYYSAVLTEDLKSLKQMALETKEKGTEKWNTLMTKLSDFLQTVPEKAEEVSKFLLNLGEKAGLILLGLIVVPFYLAFKGGELVYKLGSQFVDVLSNTASSVWEELKTIPSTVKAGYDSVQKVPVKENRRTVLSFDDFLRRG
jgi:phage-related protein